MLKRFSPQVEWSSEESFEECDESGSEDESVVCFVFSCL
jgi:hypothetical protein